MVKSRDPDRPKRYMSAFLLFLNDFRKRNNNRGYSITEMTQKGAAVWRTLASREKQPYEERSAKLKEKYDRDFLKYQEKVKTRKRDGEDIITKRRHQKKDPNKPKKALSAYMMFMQDFRKKNHNRGWDVKEMVSKGAAVWKTLTAREKFPYEVAARKSQQTYHKKLEKYKLKQKKVAAKESVKKVSRPAKSKSVTTVIKQTTSKGGRLATRITKTKVVQRSQPRSRSASSAASKRRR